VIGSVVPGTVRIEGGEMLGRVTFSGTPDVADIVSKVRNGHIKKVSIAYQVYVYETRDPGDGKRLEMRAVDWEPIEVSFCALPAEFAAGARSGPLAAVGARDQQTQQGGCPCIIRGAAALPNQEEDMNDRNERADDDTRAENNTNEERREERQEEHREDRQDERREDRPAGLTATRIRSVCARSDVGDKFALTLIERNETNPFSEAALTDAIASEIETRRRRSPINGVGRVGTEDAGYGRAIETAVLLRANPTITITDERALADARDFRGMTLMEMARDYLQRSGTSTSGMGRLELAGAALGLRGGQMTTSDFANALSSAVSKRVRTAYQAAPQTFGPIVSRGTLPDFKATNIIGLGDAPQLLLVKENAEFTYGAISDTGMSYSLATYGKIIAITRQAIINDDQNLFSRIPTMFGRKAADLESDLVWGTLTSNPTMSDSVALFHASHGNLAASGGAISVTTVAAGEQSMLQQTSLEGGYLSIRPAYLVVGPAKKVEAQQFLTAVMATQTSNVNPYPGNLQLIVEPRITGNQWFLLADPAAFDTIELAHLDGQETLYIETQPGFDVDGVKTKARLDVGATPIDYRGFYKNPGN
jgi:phage major head subunit gpT-like protein